MEYRQFHHIQWGDAMALLAPIGALIVSSWRESVPWFFAYIVLTVLSGIFDYFSVRRQPGSDEDHRVFLPSILPRCLHHIFLCDILSWRWIRSKPAGSAAPVAGRGTEESERVLLNVLPSSIADRLKKHQALIADGHADVTGDVCRPV